MNMVVSFDKPIISKEEAKAKGLTRYFTGVPCGRNHLEERMASSGDCVVCKRINGKKYRENNVEKERERHQKYSKENFERFREYKNSYNKEYQKKLKEDKPRLSKYWRDAYLANPERVKRRAYFRTLCKRGKGDIKLNQEEKKLNDQIYQLRDYLNLKAGYEKYNVDHLIPFEAINYKTRKRLSISGFHHPINLRIIEATENQSKGNKFRPKDAFYFLRNLHWWVHRNKNKNLTRKSLAIPIKNV